jgi:hypothetical protein
MRSINLSELMRLHFARFNNWMNLPLSSGEALTSLSVSLSLSFCLSLDLYLLSPVPLLAFVQNLKWRECSCRLSSLVRCVVSPVPQSSSLSLVPVLSSQPPPL